MRPISAINLKELVEDWFPALPCSIPTCSRLAAYCQIGRRQSLVWLRQEKNHRAARAQVGGFDCSQKFGLLCGLTLKGESSLIIWLVFYGYCFAQKPPDALTQFLWMR